MRSLALSFIIVLVLSGAAMAADDTAAHRANVARKSEQVMPFSMDMTKHIFTTTATGGTQIVVVTNGDATQIALVRSHLRKESVAFARGDYSDPIAIHGSAMPGLASLRQSPGKIRVSYADVPSGAKIVFATRDALMVDALHRWFAAQIRDHASHAMMKM